MADLPYESRTDSVQQKLKLLNEATNSGRYDLAMSLAESVKDTLTTERQRNPALGKPLSGPEHFTPVNQLPAVWANWARGWKYCKPITLFETVGISRKRETVDILVAFLSEQVSDLAREMRVVQIYDNEGTLQEVTCQVHSLAYEEKQLFCHIVFQADVAMHESARFLIFYGNENAELPCYSTDLRVSGEGYGLDIENEFFTAQLSRQMGQLERMTYKREHGLELFAGGKGHGEPPGIDWGHDYVDPGNFQKIRMRNWQACPNYEVVRGPLMVEVRRWGFPHSPLHPVYTPSRMHMDQTYRFYAGQPYFLKEATFEMLQDFTINAMRDDEWVFSGYSFTDQIWIDRHGKLHEGKVPPTETDELWGVGFYHHESRDAFVALWLEHSSNGIDAIKHNAHPSLFYEGHGQLWSRYPLRKTDLKAGSSIQLKNAYLTSPFPASDAAKQIEQFRHQLLNPVEVRADELPQSMMARSNGALARPGETEQTAPLKPAVWRALKQVRDEQLYEIEVSIVDLGYVYDVSVRNRTAHILVTMPHRGRPVYEFLVTAGGGRVEAGIRERVLQIADIDRVVVDFTWEPAWTLARLNDKARQALGI